MREFRFRIWLEKPKQMYLFDFGEPVNEWWDDQTLVMQYIGLKDMDGQMIFEGDIIQETKITHNDGTKDDAFVVEWEDAMSPPLDYWLDFDTSKVIGNIYQNPDMIK